MFSDRVGRLVSGRSVATLCKNVASKLSMCVYMYIYPGLMLQDWNVISLFE